MSVLRLPDLRDDQRRVAALLVKPLSVAVVSCGRRWGKTTLGAAVALATAAVGGWRCAWIAPTYANSRPLWREVLVRGGGAGNVRRADRIIEFRGGGSISIFSADNADAVRGEAFDLVVLDEAARILEEAWQGAIYPTLGDRQGRALLISTPRGRNWFWREWTRAKGEGLAHHAPSSANPLPAIQEMARKAKAVMSERMYRQEILAEFIEHGSGVFRGVRDCVIARAERSREPCVIGVDWGRTGDATVFIAIDPVTHHVVEVQRLVGVEFAHQRAALRALWERTGRGHIVVEANSIGQAQLEELQRMGLPVAGFTLTNASKAAIIDALVLAIERRDVGLPSADWLLEELEAFESEQLASGLVRYAAPSGMHDDGVIALAIAWHAAQSGLGGAPAVF